MELHRISSNENEIISERANEFVDLLSKNLGAKISFDFVDGTFEIQADGFILTFTLSDHIFEIRNIDTLGNEGMGRKIVGAINEYVDENNFEVIASNVLDSARGFWEKMGYQEGVEEDEYFRAA